MISLNDRLSQYLETDVVLKSVKPEGSVTRIVGLTVEISGLKVAIGDTCEIKTLSGKFVDAEVIGFSAKTAFLMPLMHVEGIVAGSKIYPKENDKMIPSGSMILGRVIDGMGNPIDGKGELVSDKYIPKIGPVINPLSREPISEPLDVGVRAINSLLTVGKGQRMGLFAGSGVGKSVLLGMMTRFTEADVVVVGLIGERGREVKEFIDHSLGKEGLARAVVVASPADDSPLMRLRASELATRIAEGYREEGKNVLLLMDSLTRYAQAQREIALSIGEPPATKGYPPSVFAKLPKLVERAGNGEKGQGSITAFYTVLTEGDDNQDPIADASRAILDGHVVLSRDLAEMGHYPAIDVEASISRSMPQTVTEGKLASAQVFKRLWSKYNQNRELLTVGAYVSGADREADLSIQAAPALEAFLTQKMDEQITIGNADNDLNMIINEIQSLQK
jgi:flagellum-specific ATP synthase